MSRRRIDPRKRIGSAASSGNFRFDLTPERLKILEAALGRKLSRAMRVGIVEIVNQYVAVEQFERHAPRLDDVLKLINEIRIEAEHFPKSLNENLGHSEVDFGPAEYVETIIDNELVALGYPRDAVK